MKEILSMIILVVLLIGVSSGTAFNNSSFDTVTGLTQKGGSNGRG
jgi:uncharacterized protein YxeA